MILSSSSGLAWVGVLFAGALWGGGAIVGNILLERGMSPLSLSLARFVLGLPLLWWWHLRQRSSRRWCDLDARARIIVVGTGVAMALSVSSWFAGIAALGAAVPTVIAICGAPVIVAGVSIARGYERLTRRLLCTLLLALAGVALISAPADLALPTGHLAGLAWSLAAAALQAVVVLGNARMPSDIPAISASAWGMAAAAVCMTLIAVPRGVTWPSGLDWMGVAYTGVVTTSIAYAMFAWGARRLTPTAAVLGVAVEPLVATVLSAWLLGESLTARQGLGAALLVAALFVLASPAKARSLDDRG